MTIRKSEVIRIRNKYGFSRNWADAVVAIMYHDKIDDVEAVSKFLKWKAEKDDSHSLQ